MSKIIHSRTRSRRYTRDMKLTKYEHACVVLEEQGKRLVIDPGAFSMPNIAELTDVVAIVITHTHFDHIDDARVRQILSGNPYALVFSTAETATNHPDVLITTVASGQRVSVGPFSLTFTGGEHAILHESMPRFQNIGIIVNDGIVYYPGDSFVPAGLPVQTLLVPAAGPWMRAGEAMDFLVAEKPQRAIPTHDAILSDQGKTIYDSMLSSVGVAYQRLTPGESIDL